MGEFQPLGDRELDAGVASLKITHAVDPDRYRLVEFDMMRARYAPLTVSWSMFWKWDGLRLLEIPVYGCWEVRYAT